MNSRRDLAFSNPTITSVPQPGISKVDSSFDALTAFMNSFQTQIAGRLENEFETQARLYFNFDFGHSILEVTANPVFNYTWEITDVSSLSNASHHIQVEQLRLVPQTIRNAMLNINEIFPQDNKYLVRARCKKVTFGREILIGQILLLAAPPITEPQPTVKPKKKAEASVEDELVSA